MKREERDSGLKERTGKESLAGINVKDAISDLRKRLNLDKKNPIFAYIEKFDNYFKKKKVVLEAGEPLFLPGVDTNLYIIISGGLDIFRHMVGGLKKEIGKAYAGSFLGEGVIFGRTHKDVEAVANSKTVLFSLSKEDLETLEQESPTEAIELYKFIIELTNKRLLDSGKELADIYEATHRIVDMSRSEEKGFMDIMQYVKSLLQVDYIIYIENHPAVSGLFYYKYSTSLPNVGNLNRKAGDEVTANMGGISPCGGEFFGTKAKDSIYIVALKNSEALKGFILLGKRKGVITDNEMRVGDNMGPLLASVIEKYQKQEDEKAREMSKKNYFDNSLNFI